MSFKRLEIRHLVKAFGGEIVLSDFSLSACGGETVGLIGPNGAGKTTLFNVITGFLSPEKGTVSFDGTKLVGLPPFRIANLGVCRTFQDVRLIRPLTTVENVLLASRDRTGERLVDVLFRWKRTTRRESKMREAAISLLESVGLLDTVDVAGGELSYGQQKLLSLVCCLASGAELILLDEPIAGIAPEMRGEILSIIRELPNKGKCVVVIEHNFDAISSICDRVIFMDAGEKKSEGTPDEIQTDPIVIETYLG